MVDDSLRNLSGKTVLITGASKGIGAAAAQSFAQAGARVMLLARNEEALLQQVSQIRAAGGLADSLPCDIARMTEVQQAVERCVQTFGSLDILINNAGIIDPISRLDRSDPEAWGHVIDVNVKGVYHAARTALPIMLEQQGGTILNISSGAATSPLEGWSHYCASKAAVLALTGCLDKEYRDRAIRAIGLSPGTVATDMQRQIKASGINPVSQLDFDSHIPPEWVAKALLWLCAPEADPYLGQDFSLKTPEGRALVGLAA